LKVRCLFVIQYFFRTRSFFNTSPLHATIN
jgi:hypothetical protein